MRQHGSITDDQAIDPKDELEPIPLQYRSVGDKKRASRMARGAALENLRQGVWILLIAAAALTVWWWVQLDRLEDGPRITFALVGGLLSGAATAVLLGVVLWLGYEYRLRRATPEDGVVESGFGEEAFVLKSSETFVRTEYSAVKWIDYRADFVLVRYRSELTLLYPIELFPPDAVRSRIPPKGRLGHRR